MPPGNGSRLSTTGSSVGSKKIRKIQSNTSIPLRDIPTRTVKKLAIPDDNKKFTDGHNSDLSCLTVLPEQSVVEPGTASKVATAVSTAVSAINPFAPGAEKLALEWIDLIREYAEGCKLLNRETAAQNQQPTPRNYLGLGKTESSLNKLMDFAESAFRRDERVVKVKSPAIAIGDLHGNLKDLLVLDRTFLLQSTGEYAQHRFVFLGDYIDRGNYSVECAIYLFAIKILNPSRYCIVRGNHEVSIVNKAYTFKHECYAKFSTSGENVWNRFNRVFECMPLCAVIDDKIFAAHGGVPCGNEPSKPVMIRELDATPCPLSLAYANLKQYAIQWEVMWNDPLNTTEFEEIMQIHPPERPGHKEAVKYGFFPNFKRLTGYFFNESATKRFLSANKLSSVIRAHEHCQDGTDVKQSGMCYTVFTTSNYQNGNKAGIIRIEGNSIRPKIIQTDVINLHDTGNQVSG